MSLTLGIIASSRGNIVPPLDTYGGAAAAYSTRLLSSAYGGSAVRVRRSFDNAEQDIGFSGGAIDETALMNFVGYQNLFLQSQTFTNVVWDKAQSTVTANAGTDPFGGNNATRWLSDVGSTTHYMSQTVTLSAGTSYTISFYVKSNTGSSQQFRLFLNNGITDVSANLTATTDWQRFTYSVVGVAGPTVQGISRPNTNAAVDLLIYGAQVNVGTTAQTYQVTTSAARSGDGFVTKWYTQDGNGENLLLQSQTFEDVYWTKENSTISANTVETTAPNGTNTADILNEGVATGVHRVDSPLISFSSRHSASVYLKYKSARYVRLVIGGAVNDPVIDNRRADFDLVNGVILRDTLYSATAQIAPVGGGWFRVSFVMQSPSITVSNRFSITMLDAAGSDTVSYTGTNREVYIWGAQLSQSTWLQGYQATTTSQVFRRDVFQSTAANQPRIVNGGVIERENGKAAIDHTSTQILNLPAGSPINLATTYTLLAAFKQDVTGKEVFGNASPSSYGFYTDSSGTYHNANSFGGTSSGYGLNYNLFSLYRNGTVAINMLRNGVQYGSQFNLALNNSFTFSSISGEGPSFNLDGRISEGILYPTALVATLPDINRNLGSYYQTQWTGASSGLLDQFGGAAAAYSLRNLSSLYRGPLIRVRRSSDNAETDIGGTYNGDLDVASLLSFTGGQNLLTNSEDFSVGWVTTNSGITINATISPNGTLTADKYVETAVNGFHGMYQEYSIPSISPMTLSFYAKAAERRYISIAFYSLTSPFNTVNVVFDIVNGAVNYNLIAASGILISASIQSVGNGWFRCSVTGNINATGASRFQINLRESETVNSYLGVAGSGVYIWGAQLNTGILQPYIPTTTTAVNGANAFVTKWYTQDANYQNLYLQSETFTTASWVKNSSTVTANAGTDPFGGNNATRWVGTTNHYLAQSVTLVNGQSYTVSFYVKSNTGSTQLFRFLACDAIVSSDLTATTDWQRFQFTFVANTSLLHGIIRPSAGTASDLLIFGAQLNEGSVAFPYTATTTTVSQRRDAIQATAASQPRIVNAGGVESEGNRPAVFWTDGSGMRLTASFPAIPSPQSFFMVNRIGATSGILAASLFDSYDNVLNAYYFSGTTESPNNIFRYQSGAVLDVPANPIPVQNITNVIHDTVTNIYDNNLLTISGNAGSNTLSGLSIGNVRGNPTTIVSANIYDWFGDIQEFIVYPSNLATRLAVNSNINSYYRIYWQGNGTALLDSFSGASAAYSLRNLSSAYTGPLIRVRRSNDNVERDIYGTFGGDLDIASLVAFVGANSGFVTTWYDQSGNARHATQATAGSQPRIVNAGVVETEGGKPTLFFDGTNDSLGASSGLDILQNVGYASGFSVTANNSSAAGYRTIYNISTNAVGGTTRAGLFINGTLYETGGRRLDADGYQSVSGSVVNTSLRLLSNIIQYQTSDAYLYLNNGLIASTTSFQTDGNTSNTASNEFRIGSTSTSFYWSGDIQEVIVYNTNQFSSRSPIESNINNYYKIY